MKIRLIFFFTFIAISFFIYKYFQNTTNEDWTTYSKTEKGVKIYPTTLQEKKETNIPLPLPTQKTSKKPESKKEITRKNIGLPHDKKLEEMDLNFKNEFNEDWKKLLGEKLLDNQQDGTRIIIKRIDSLLEIKQKDATFYEVAIIKFVDPQGKQSSFRALVDSQTGRVYRRWDKTVFENYKKEKTGLTPSGTLQSN